LLTCNLAVNLVVVVVVERDVCCGIHLRLRLLDLLLFPLLPEMFLQLRLCLSVRHLLELLAFANT